jgi:hypothetical protein
MTPNTRDKKAEKVVSTQLNSSLARTTGKRPIVPLRWGEKVDVLEYFPVQPIFAIQKTFLVGIFVVVSWVFAIKGPVNFSVWYTQRIALAVASITTGVYCLLLLYWELYRRRMTCFIEDFRIFTARGVFARTVSTGYVNPYWDCKIDQRFLDWLFNVWYFKNYADFAKGKHLYSIPALSRKDAWDCLAFFNREADRHLGLQESAIQKMELLANKSLRAAEEALVDEKDHS